jgi:hypothetical protein
MAVQAVTMVFIREIVCIYADIVRERIALALPITREALLVV